MDGFVGRGVQNLRLKPPTFSAKKSEHIKQFFSKFEKYFAHLNIDEGDKVDAIGLCFEGDPLDIYDAILKDDEDIDYDDIKEKLITYFDDEKLDLVVRSKMSHRKLLPDENVTQYYTDLRRESIKINLPDRALLHSFIEGLPEKMAEHLICKNPNTSMEALNCARTLEQVKEMFYPSQKKSALDTLKNEIKDAKISAATGSGNNGSEKIREAMKNVSELRHEISEIKDALKSLAARNIPSQDTNMQNSFQNSFQTTSNQNMEQNLTQNGNFQNFQNQSFDDGNECYNNDQQNWDNHSQNDYNDKNWRQRPNQDNNFTSKNQPRVNMIKTNIDAVHIADDMTLTGFIGNQKVSILLDSGSEISFMGKKMVEKLRENMKIEPSVYSKLTAVNGTNADIQGMSRQNVKIGNFESILKLNIVPESDQEILLGMDFVRQYVHSINFHKNTIDLMNSGKMYQTKMNFSDPSRSPNIRATISAKLSEKVTFNPGEEKFVKIHVGNNSVTQKSVFVANEWSKRLGIVIENQFISEGSKIIRIMAKNVSDKIKIIHANRRIGILQPQTKSEVLTVTIKKSMNKQNIPDQHKIDQNCQKQEQNNNVRQKEAKVFLRKSSQKRQKNHKRFYFQKNANIGQERNNSRTKYLRFT